MRKLTSHEVRKIARRHRNESPDIPTAGLRAGVSLEIFGYFLGSAWVGKYFVDSKIPFFHNDQDINSPKFVGIRRIRELADMLLNLQHLEGFDEPLRKLRDDSVETGFAAFEAAKLIYRSGTSFKFVIPSGVPGNDYDFLAFVKTKNYVAVEAKCKLSSTAMQPRKIMKALTRARDQLPTELPGVVMLRVPAWWAERSDLQGPLARAAENILHYSDSLAGILVFSNKFIEEPSADGQPKRQASMIVAREFWSKKSNLVNAPEWGLCRSSIFDDAGWISVAKLLNEPWLRPPLSQR